MIPNFALKPEVSIKKAGITSPEQARAKGYSESQISQAFGAQRFNTKQKTASKNFTATGLTGKIGVLTGIGANTDRNLTVNLSSLTTKNAKVKKMMGRGITSVTVPDVKYRTAFQKGQEDKFSNLINTPTTQSAIGSIASDLSYKLFEDEAKDLQPKFHF
jgi:hypothetical protein